MVFPDTASEYEFETEDVKDKSPDKEPMERLEEALKLCGFGRFHVRLLLATLTANFASNATTITQSYILSSAECDLNMTNIQKGLLNAASFLGLISIALFTGILANAFGRRKFLITGHLGMCFFGLLAGSSQNYWTLMVAKFGDGMSLSFCFNMYTSIVAEFCHAGIRDRVLMYSSTLLCISQITTAALAWVVVPQNWNFTPWEGYFHLHSWNIYLYICSAWGALAALQYYFLQESPKFLLATGQSEAALEVLRRLYKENTGKSKDTFPIKSLVEKATSLPIYETNIKKQMTEALHSVKDLFKRPLVLHLFLASFYCFASLLTLSSLRLWYPQLSTIVEHYKQDFGDTSEFCTMLDTYMISRQAVNTDNITEIVACVPKLSGSETYINVIIVSCVAFLFMCLNAILIERFSMNVLCFASLTICALCTLGLQWANTSLQIVILMSAVIGLNTSATTVFGSMSVRMFPTMLRALAMSLIIIFGRIGSLIGNVVLPVLLEMSCVVTFGVFAVSLFAVALLSLTLPNPNSKKNIIGGDR